ncbi:hypothetical protein H6769_00975 [Candidatus Peribacteria bacterium]|nr:hypothetical protein [Candidatus Peribacteria bacterium]
MKSVIKKMKNQKLIIGIILFLILTNLSSCAPSGYESDQAGFFSGVWHGFIIVFSLIGKLFNADIGIYAEHNSGFFYWLGFIIGIGGFSGGGANIKE